MKGKFFYKIDYNTDNGKKQHRNSKVGKNYHNLESSGPKAGKTLYFWVCIPHFGTDTVEKQGSGCIICAEKAILKDVAGQKTFRRKQDYDQKQQKRVQQKRIREKRIQQKPEEQQRLQSCERP